MTCLFLASCERSVFTGFIEPTDFENCKIYVESNPSKASIYIDGLNSGKTTPDTINWLTSGKNKITLKLDLYEDTTETVFLSKDITNKLYIDFESNSRNYGKIECTSFPSNAELLLNNKSTNQKTPTIIKGLLPAHYYLKYRYPLHRDDSLLVTVISNRTTPANITLEDTTKWVSYDSYTAKLPSNTVFSVVADKQNTIWIATERGLVRKKGSDLYTFNTSNSILRTNIINHVAVDSRNRIWVSTPLGIYVVDNSIITDYSYNLPMQIFRMIVFGKTGTVWAATSIGLCRLDGTNWTIFNTSNSGIRDNYVPCIAIDKDDKIWVGSSSGYSGLSVFDGTFWTYHNPTSINSVQIGSSTLSIHISEDGKVWVGSNRYPSPGGPLICYDGTSWSLVAKNAFGIQMFQSINSSNDKVFFGAKTGLGILYKDGSTKFINYGNARINYLWINSLTFDNNGDLWIGTLINGAAKFKKEYF